MVLLLEVVGPTVNEVGETMLRLMVVSSGFGDQDWVMLEVLVDLRNW